VDRDSPQLYRRALGAFTTGVAVVTAEDGEGALGLTINSFTSVSLDPPLVLWCLGDASDRRHLFAEASHFVINILAAEDQAHSERFSRGAHRMGPDELDRADSGAPRLKGALASFDCETHDRIEMGDHLVIVGRVTGFTVREGDALTFFRGRYGSAA
jgi:flavin reductase (DIM6/NTAB) family NADH-FMN oxidoreductase RutF